MYRAVLYFSDAPISDDVAKTSHIQDISMLINENTEHNVYGVLAQNNNKFLHIIEGEYDVVEALLGALKNDTRNSALSTVIDLKIKDRIYNDWEFIDSPSKKQSNLLSQFLRRCIDELPLIEQQQHDILEDFVNNIFH